MFNYFPTKESMFFDRTDATAATIAERVRRRDGESLGQSVMSCLFQGTPSRHWTRMDERHHLELFRRFCEVAKDSPTLRGAPYLELERFMVTVGAALAERVGAVHSSVRGTRAVTRISRGGDGWMSQRGGFPVLLSSPAGFSIGL